MKTWWLCLVVICLWVTSCISSSYQRLRNTSGVAGSDFHAQLPFDYGSKLIVINVSIRGNTYPFIFDTGASSTVISRALADSLKLKSRTRITTRDSRGQKKKLPVGMLDTLQIGGVTFYNSTAIVVDWPEPSAIECISWAGILGNNIIRHANWRIDYQRQLIELSSDTLGKEEDFFFTDMHFAHSRPRLDIAVDSFAFEKVLLDLGSGGGIDLQLARAKKKMGKSLKHYLRSKALDGSSEGLFGTFLDSNYILRASALHMGKTRVYEPVVSLEARSKSKVGNRLLENFVLYLDYTNKRIGFSVREKDITYGYQKTFGFVPGLRDSIFRVTSIHLAGDAYARGIRQGDTLLSIAHKTPADFDYDPCRVYAFVRALSGNDSVQFVTKKSPDYLQTLYLKSL